VCSVREGLATWFAGRCTGARVYNIWQAGPHRAFVAAGAEMC
jgi:hypothetical protein